MSSPQVDQKTTIADLREVANTFKDRVIEVHPDQVEEIILFGSVARGEISNDGNSDIDLLIVIKSKDIEIMKDITGIAFEISLETKQDVSPKVYTRDEIRTQMEQGTPFMEEVLRDEVALYGSLADIGGTS